MAGMRDYTDDELELVRKNFSGRYALRDRCYFGPYRWVCG